MNIRRVNKSDKGKLKEIKPSITEDKIDKRLGRQSQKKVDFLILEDKGLPMSFVLLKWDGKPTHPECPDIEDLYTKEDFRGKGYGAKLIKECENRAVKKGFRKICLAVNPTQNLKAKSYYEKLGFRHDGGKKYVDGVYEGVEDWVIDMEKKLES